LIIASIPSASAWTIAFRVITSLWSRHTDIEHRHLSLRTGTSWHLPPLFPLSSWFQGSSAKGPGRVKTPRQKRPLEICSSHLGTASRAGRTGPCHHRFAIVRCGSWCGRCCRRGRHRRRTGQPSRRRRSNGASPSDQGASTSWTNGSVISWRASLTATAGRYRRNSALSSTSYAMLMLSLTLNEDFLEQPLRHRRFSHFSVQRLQLRIQLLSRTSS